MLLIVSNDVKLISKVYYIIIMGLMDSLSTFLQIIWMKMNKNLE